MSKKKHHAHTENKRSAGILLHITSLSSHFGIGDLGPEARAFAKFLHRSKQTYWQVLPLNPTESRQGHSPYSATSSMAGNTLLISPEILVSDGLLKPEQIKLYERPVKKAVDFNKAQVIRKKLFDEAYGNFLQDKSSPLLPKFEKFCKKEAHWLDDFALYVTIKEENKDNPWHLWPDDLKLRKEEALKEFTQAHQDSINKEKWLQFIFLDQWKRLKSYCNDIGISIFGDLPIYVSYDSADVWSHQKIFKLDMDGGMSGIAGVPPDYFNEKGQLWGMPVFRWGKLKNLNYDWWIKRIHKNTELYDLIRLDHFRAFSSYWEVPANEETAINGEWKKGPGPTFFKEVEKALGKLPFVAEDLGDIDDAVYQLRDAFHLPGMKVLQFAFGDNMPISEHTPHNYTTNFIVYTGTHDNNTTRGWYKKELSRKDRMRINTYIGEHVHKKNIHLELSKAAYASVAKTVILPMQDVLGLGRKARMNMPASTEENWKWRIKSNMITSKDRKRLKNWTRMYNRD